MNYFLKDINISTDILYIILIKCNILNKLVRACEYDFMLEFLDTSPLFLFTFDITLSVMDLFCFKSYVVSKIRETSKILCTQHAFWCILSYSFLFYFKTLFSWIHLLFLYFQSQKYLTKILFSYRFSVC